MFNVQRALELGDVEYEDPDRFKWKIPKVPEIPNAVWINPLKLDINQCIK